jgi:hypothetical protein
MPRKFERISVSIDPELRASTKRRQRELGLASLSGYIIQLIRRDVISKKDEGFFVPETPETKNPFKDGDIVKARDSENPERFLLTTVSDTIAKAMKVEPNFDATVIAFKKNQFGPWYKRFEKVGRASGEK